MAATENGKILTTKNIYEKLANIILSISRGIAIYGTKNKIHALESKRYKNNFYGEYCGL